jgi:hypothetical protein
LPFLLSLFLSFYPPINFSVVPVDIKQIDLFLLVLMGSGFPLLYWLESLSNRLCFAGTQVRPLFISLTAAVDFLFDLFTPSFSNLIIFIFVPSFRTHSIECTMRL